MALVTVSLTTLDKIKRYTTVYHNDLYCEYYEAQADNSFYFKERTNPDIINSFASLSRKYNLYNMYNFIIQFPDFMDTELTNPDALTINAGLFMNLWKESDYPIKVYDYLAVIEHGPIKGYHINFMLFSTDPLTTSQLTDFKKCFYHPYLDVIYGGKVVNTHSMVKYEKIKSPGAWINYMHKAPLCIIGRSLEVLRMFSNFDRTHIFPVDSVPKTYKRTLDGSPLFTQNALVQYFFHCFDRNIIDFNDVVRDPGAIGHLHNINFQKTYQTCFLSFIAKRTLTDEILYIKWQFKQLSVDERCFCPINDWLMHHNINADNFGKKIAMWFLAMLKKNVLYFIGPANCGKSHFARKLWELFLIHKQILADGLYTFANLQNAGCGLWEEPYITHDNVDTCKLVFEGEPSTEVAVKHSPSLKLGKRIPLIVTTNSEISHWCTAQAPHLEVRLFRIECKQPIDTEKSFCTGEASDHYCPRIIDHTNHDFPQEFLDFEQKLLNSDGRSSSPISITSDSCTQHQGRRTACTPEELQRINIAANNITFCEGLHRIERNHILTFAFYHIAKWFKVFEAENKPFQHIDALRLSKAFVNFAPECDNYNICKNSIVRNF